ncbi:MAG: hypothetical protein ACI9J5_000282 [Paraglaciecola sp.]|jgi:hypothetical protein
MQTTPLIFLCNNDVFTDQSVLLTSFGQTQDSEVLGTLQPNMWWFCAQYWCDEINVSGDSPNNTN